MKKAIVTLAVALLAGSPLLAQQRNPRSTSANRSTGAGNGSSINPTQPTDKPTGSNNGTTPGAGTGNTVDQNYATGSAAGPAGVGSTMTTATDARSSTMTSPTTVKAKKKKPRSDSQQ